MSLSSEPERILRAAILCVLGVVVASGIAHALLGIDVAGQLHFFSLCPFHAVGIPCPGCGMTRAFLLLSQFRFADAVAANPAAPFLFVAMVWRLLRPRGSCYALPRDSPGCFSDWTEKCRGCPLVPRRRLCRPEGETKPIVAVSVLPQAFFVHRIAGDLCSNP